MNEKFNKERLRNFGTKFQSMKWKKMQKEELGDR
jgi:hypothetical protein